MGREARRWAVRLNRREYAEPSEIVEARLGYRRSSLCTFTTEIQGEDDQHCGMRGRRRMDEVSYLLSKAVTSSSASGRHSASRKSTESE